MDPSQYRDNDYNDSQRIIQEQEKIIRELNTKMMEQEDMVLGLKDNMKNLSIELAAVKRDRDECLKAMQANSVSPIFNASTQKREEFWRIIHENVAFLREKNKFENDTRSKIDEKDDEILKQRVMIEHLRKEIADNKIIVETNRKLQSELENLYDNLLKEQAKNKDLTIKIMGLEKQMQISEQKEKEASKQLELTNSTLRRKIDIFTEEQKSIIGYIRTLKGQTVNIGPAFNVPSKDITATKVQSKNYPAHNANIDQFLLRLKTTSIHTEKYSEILDTITEILRSVRESQEPEDAANPSPRKSGIYVILMKKLEDPSNYRLFLKGLQSSNNKVVISSQNLLFELRGIDTRTQDFLENGLIPSMAKTLRGSNDPLLKANCLLLFVDLAGASPKVSQELYNNNLSFFLSTELKKSFNLAASTSDYLLSVLRLIAIMLQDGYGKREFVQDDLIMIYFSLMQETDSWEISKAILKVIPFLSEDKEKRMRIYDNGGFTFLWRRFLESERMHDQEVLHLYIEALVQFVKDENIHLLFMTSEKVFETFEIFSRCLSFPNSLPPGPRAAALDIISELVRSSSKTPEFETQMIENDLPNILLTQLREGDATSQKKCLTTLIFLREFIFNHADQFRVPIKTLTALLSSKDKDVVILALRFMDMLSEEPQLLDDMAEIGITTVVSAFFVHNPKEIDPSVLVEAGYFLLKLQENPTAVQQMLDSQTFLTILPLGTHTNHEVKKFWFHAIAEFANHREFRAQLESQAIYLNFIKRAIQEFESIYSEQLCFALRVLCQSRLLANYLADENTIVHLFNFFYEFIKTAKPEFIIYILEIMALLAHNSEGRKQLLKNTFMLDILGIQMQKEDPQIADTAGRLVIFLLESSPEDTTLLKDAILDSVMIYGQSQSEQSRVFAKTIISILNEDPEYAQRLGFMHNPLDAAGDVNGGYEEGGAEGEGEDEGEEGA